MNRLIEANLDAIRALCRDYGVAKLEIFGSAATDNFEPERSDIDFLVEYPPDYDFGPWLARHQDLGEALANLLGRKVDLIMTSALRNKWFRQEANKTRRVIYDASDVARAMPTSHRCGYSAGGHVGPPLQRRHPVGADPRVRPRQQPQGDTSSSVLPKSPKWLDDVATGCGSIIEYTAGRSKADYEDDRLLRSAVERNLEIISLALLRLEQTDPATAGRLRDYRRITDLHERLIRCVTINSLQVWPIIQETLPVLKADVAQLLQEVDDA